MGIWCVNYYYRPQRTCEGYVFTGVCLSIGGRGFAPGGCLVWGVCSQGDAGPGGVPGRGLVSRHALRQTPGRDGYCCGRHASQWNAFPFVLKITVYSNNLTFGSMYGFSEEEFHTA